MKKVQFFIGLLIILISIGLIYSLFISYQNFELIKITGVSFYAWLNTQSPFLAGAIAVWIMGVGTYIFRYLPSRLWGIIIKQTTVVLIINNDTDAYRQFFNWYEKSGNSMYSRTLTILESVFNIETNDGWQRETKLSAGYGTHYFFFNKRIFMVTRIEKEAQNTKETKESINIKTIGRSHAPFNTLLKEIQPPAIKRKSITTLYVRKGEGWRQLTNQSVRTFDSVILPRETKKSLIHHLEEFLGKKEWYTKHGIPYRTGIMLYGPAGTGKTSLLKGLCEYFDKPLYIINLDMLTDDMLLDAFTSIPANSIILIEDIDTYSMAGKRKEEDDDSDDSKKQFFGITLSGLLNAIDGIVSSDGRMLFATTNHVNKLDPALIRKGRFNLSLELTYLTEETILIFFTRFYPDFVVPTNTEFKYDITPAALQAKIMDNIKKPEAVLEYCLEDKQALKLIEN